MNDAANNELENRLHRLGTSSVPALDASRVDAIEQRLLTKSEPTRRTAWVVAAAASVVLVGVVALAIRRDEPNKLQPGSESTTTLADVVPDVVPEPSFRLAVDRVGSELEFSWRQYPGDDDTRYVLLQVTAAGLTTWPATEADVAVTTPDLATTTATVTLRATEQRSWVVVVLGKNRSLIAVSAVATSD